MVQDLEPAKCSHAASGELCKPRGFGGSRQDKPIKPTWHSSTETGLRPISSVSAAPCPHALQGQRATPALWGTKFKTRKNKAWESPAGKEDTQTTPGHQVLATVMAAACSPPTNQAPSLDDPFQMALKVQRPGKN